MSIFAHKYNTNVSLRYNTNVSGIIQMSHSGIIQFHTLGLPLVCIPQCSTNQLLDELPYVVHNNVVAQLGAEVQCLLNGSKCLWLQQVSHTDDGDKAVEVVQVLPNDGTETRVNIAHRMGAKAELGDGRAGCILLVDRAVEEGVCEALPGAH